MLLGPCLFAQDLRDSRSVGQGSQIKEGDRRNTGGGGGGSTTPSDAPKKKKDDKKTKIEQTDDPLAGIH